MNSFLIGLGIAGTVVTTVTAAPPPTPTPGGEVYIVQADDWLSKLAQKYYGDVLAYPAIVEATNAKAAEDTTFAPITNPDVIEVGQKLWIPTTLPVSVNSPEQGILTQIAGLSLGAENLAFSPDDQLLAVGHSQGVQVWDTNTWQLRWSVPYSNSVRQVAFSPDSQWLAAGLAGDEPALAIWQTQTWPQVARLEVEDALIKQVEFSPDGRLLAALLGSPGQEQIWMWEVPTWRLASQIALSDVAWDITFSPDSRRLAVGLGQEAVNEGQLWDVTTGSLVARMPHTGQVLTTAFSPNGRWLATSGGNSQVKVWQIPEGK